MNHFKFVYTYVETVLFRENIRQRLAAVKWSLEITFIDPCKMYVLSLSILQRQPSFFSLDIHLSYF